MLTAAARHLLLTSINLLSMEKNLKIADLGIQVIITITCIIRAMVLARLEEMLWFYLVLGSWQVVSFIGHYLAGPGWLHRKARKEYGTLLLWILVLFVVMYLLARMELPLIFFFLFGMLVAGPVMAAWYFIIGLREWTMIRHRSLIHLK